MGAILGVLGALAGKVPLKYWFILVAIATICIGLFAGAWHERGIGEAKCKTAIEEATKEAAKEAAKLQTQLDALAKKQDDPVQQALATPQPTHIGFSCKFTPAEVNDIKDKLQ